MHDESQRRRDGAQPRKPHVMLIPFHFPPIQGSTGSLRSRAFAKWLPDFGWRVTVLTANERAYPAIAPENRAMIPESTTVERAFALDTQRHLSLRGRYPRWFALPDRWVTWIIGGVIRGWRVCRRDRPDVLYSTYPIPSSHVIAFLLHRITGVPWVAEFRDPMTEEGYPENRTERKVRLWIESKVCQYAKRIVVVTPSARAMYIDKAGRGDDFVVEIANGYDPAKDAGDAEAEADRLPENTAQHDKTVVLHSGLLYQGERNPEPLLEALADVAKEKPALVDGVQFVFRGAGNEAGYRDAAERLGVAHVARFEPLIPYAEAKREAAAADALMVLQGSVCNRQIPAKLYECAASGLPILCIADPQGDTARVAREIGIAGGARLEHAAEIKPLLTAFLEDLRAGRAHGVDPALAEGMSRRARTRELAACLDEVAGRDA